LDGYAATHRTVREMNADGGLPADTKLRSSKYLNKRRRERQMQRFKSSPRAQRFLSAHAFIHGHFHPRRNRMAAESYRASRAVAFKVWRQETCAKVAA